MYQVLKELYELTEADQAQFLRESSWLSSQLAKTFQAESAKPIKEPSVTAALSPYRSLSKRHAMA